MAKILATIRYSRAWNEYTVPSPDGRKEATYHTDDREDAIDTAIHMWSKMYPGCTADNFKI